MKQENSSKQDEYEESIKELVIVRIETQMSPNLRLSIGGQQESLDKEKMIKHVIQGDEVGKQIVEAHLNFIRAQTSGQLVTALNSV